MSKKAEKRKIDIESYDKFIGEFKGESDRAAVILGAAKLDLLLSQILLQYLTPHTGNKDELLEGDSPLGTFSAKIMLLNRLGLIDDEFTRSLHLIRKIRNSFAHEVSGCTLESGSHRDRVSDLVVQFKHKFCFIDAREIIFSDGGDGPSENFRTILTILVGRLDLLLNHISTVDCSNALTIFTDKALAKGEVENPLKKSKISTPKAPQKVGENNPDIAES